MLFPVMRFETKYGIDYRVGATEQNMRSGSQLVGYLEATSKPEAIKRLKVKISRSVELELHIYPK